MGIFLTNAAGEIVGANEEAFRIATTASTERKTRDDFSTATVRRLVLANQQSMSALSADFSTGGLVYRYRVVPLPLPARGPSPGFTVILLERGPDRDEAFSSLRAEFKLTGRELETVRLLAEGLTNKEIATSMGLSCNTVKAFLHSVMTKLRISTRAGIVGRLLTQTG